MCHGKFPSRRLFGKNYKYHHLFMANWYQKAISDIHQEMDTVREIDKFHPSLGDVGSHPLVIRYMRGIFNLRPTKVRYTEVWDVNKVLCYIFAKIM